MEFTDKRKAKRLARLFFTLGYGFMFLLVIIFIVGIVVMFTTEEGQEMVISGTLLLSLGCFSIAFCIAGGAIGQHFLNKRLYYKEAIAEYRQCRFFTTSLRKILDGDKKSRNVAIDYYDLIAEDTPRRRFMFAFILAASYYSKDKETAEKGKERLESILETYDPAKVKMTK